MHLTESVRKQDADKMWRRSEQRKRKEHHRSKPLPVPRWDCSHLYTHRPGEQISPPEKNKKVKRKRHFKVNRICSLKEEGRGAGAKGGTRILFAGALTRNKKSTAKEKEERNAKPARREVESRVFREGKRFGSPTKMSPLAMPRSGRAPASLACTAVSPLGGNAISHTLKREDHREENKRKKKTGNLLIFRCRFLFPTLPCLFPRVCHGAKDLFLSVCLNSAAEHACPTPLGFSVLAGRGLWRHPRTFLLSVRPRERLFEQPLEIGRFLEMSGLSRIAGNEADSSDVEAADGWSAAARGGEGTYRERV